MRATIILGDPSNDGHGQTESFQVEVPLLRLPNLNYYFNLAVANGIPDVTGMCEDYEDCCIETEAAELFQEQLGVEIDRVDDTAYLDTDTLAAIWVATVNKGIEYNGESGQVKIVPTDYANVYEIGGYGLFS